MVSQKRWGSGTRKVVLQNMNLTLEKWYRKVVGGSGMPKELGGLPSVTQVMVVDRLGPTMGRVLGFLVELGKLGFDPMGWGRKKWS